MGLMKTPMNDKEEDKLVDEIFEKSFYKHPHFQPENLNKRMIKGPAAADESEEEINPLTPEEMQKLHGNKKTHKVF